MGDFRVRPLLPLPEDPNALDFLFFNCSLGSGPSDVDSFFLGRSHSSFDSLANHFRLELGKGSYDVQKQPSICRGGIDIVLDEGHALSGRFKLRNDMVQVDDVSRQPVDFRGNEQVIAGFAEDFPQLRPLFEILSARLFEFDSLELESVEIGVFADIRFLGAQRMLLQCVVRGYSRVSDGYGNFLFGLSVHFFLHGNKFRMALGREKGPISFWGKAKTVQNGVGKAFMAGVTQLCNGLGTACRNATFARKICS